MQLHFLLLISFCVTAALKWDCPSDPVLKMQESNEGYFPPDKEYLGEYVGGMNCLLQIQIPAGHYAMVDWNSFPSDGDSLWAQNDYMKLDMYGVITKFYSVGPSPLNFTIKTTSNTQGILRFVWKLRRYDQKTRYDYVVQKGEESLIMRRHTNLAVFGNEKIAISTAMMENAHPYTATGAVLFDGKTFKSMHTRIGESTPLVVSTNVTFYHFLLDSGLENFAFSVNANSDVEKFGELRLRFSSDKELFVSMDASHGHSVLHLVNFQGTYYTSEITNITFKDPSDYVTYSVRRIPVKESYLISHIGGDSEITLPQPITSGNGNTIVLKKGQAVIRTTYIGSASFHTSYPLTNGVLTSPYYTQIANTASQSRSYTFVNNIGKRKSCFEILDTDDLTSVEIRDMRTDDTTLLTKKNTTYCGEFIYNENVSFKSGLPGSTLLESKGARIAYRFESLITTTTKTTPTTATKTTKRITTDTTRNVTVSTKAPPNNGFPGDRSGYSTSILLSLSFALVSTVFF